MKKTLGQLRFVMEVLPTENWEFLRSLREAASEGQIKEIRLVTVSIYRTSTAYWASCQVLDTFFHVILIVTLRGKVMERLL